MTMAKLRSLAVNNEKIHSSHWGTYLIDGSQGALKIRANPFDHDPSPILGNIIASVDHSARVAAPMVREGWLNKGPGSRTRRGCDSFVTVSWEHALDLAAAEFRRVIDQYGNKAIFGGSYGWSSAGRFHHAQSQVHRFLNCIGGYVRSVNTYSAGAAEVILPHVMGSFWNSRSSVTWPEIVSSTELLVAFGGIAEKNSQVGAGGVGRHVVRRSLLAMKERAAEFILVSPIKNDFPAQLQCDWLDVKPATDTALMFGLAHTMIDEDLYDRSFVDRCCTGFEQFRRYLFGKTDGQAKSAKWAEQITGVDAQTIKTLARKICTKRTLITVSHSLQRAQYGEQPVWMGMILAALAGQIGKQGGGYIYSLGALANVAKEKPVVSVPALPQGSNPVKTFIPVARIADMLLSPGEVYHYNGAVQMYPDIKLVHWAGGNPFHHHQNLQRLACAFRQPDTVIVQEPFWTATACHADIVFPSTITLERNDIGGVSDDAYVVAMHKVVDAYADVRDDFAILTELADRLGVKQAFTEGRSADEWVRVLFETCKADLQTRHYECPDFDSFWTAGELELPVDKDSAQWARQFRAAPDSITLGTPSGKLEFFSETISGFNYPDCPGHPVWLQPDEWLGSALVQTYPLQLIANQPHSRLHSQLDFGEYSQSTKINNREVMQIYLQDAEERNISNGDVVRVFNARGAFLAVANCTTDIRRGVIQVPTGAWYDPVLIDGKLTCVNGNPNAVTRDVGTSRLAQGCTGQLCLVEIEKFKGCIPQGRGYCPPEIKSL